MNLKYHIRINALKIRKLGLNIFRVSFSIKNNCDLNYLIGEIFIMLIFTTNKDTF